MQRTCLTAIVAGLVVLCGCTASRVSAPSECGEFVRRYLASGQPFGTAVGYHLEIAPSRGSQLFYERGQLRLTYRPYPRVAGDLISEPASAVGVQVELVDGDVLLTLIDPAGQSASMRPAACPTSTSLVGSSPGRTIRLTLD